jgi:hypothetical protein
MTDALEKTKQYRRANPGEIFLCGTACGLGTWCIELEVKVKYTLTQRAFSGKVTCRFSVEDDLPDIAAMLGKRNLIVFEPGEYKRDFFPVVRYKLAQCGAMLAAEATLDVWYGTGTLLNVNGNDPSFRAVDAANICALFGELDPWQCWKDRGTVVPPIQLQGRLAWFDCVIWVVSHTHGLDDAVMKSARMRPENKKFVVLIVGKSAPRKLLDTFLEAGIECVSLSR